MSTTTSTTLQKVEAVASMAGYSLTPHPQLPETIVCPFDMGQGRTQNVYIVPCGQSPEGQDVICFMSPCMAVKKGLLAGVSKKQALDLLRRNAELLWGSFALQTFGDMDVMVVRSTQIVDTMEVEEFKMHVNLVAIIADRYEQEHGKDVF